MLSLYLVRINWGPRSDGQTCYLVAAEGWEEAKQAIQRHENADPTTAIEVSYIGLGRKRLRAGIKMKGTFVSL